MDNLLNSSYTGWSGEDDRLLNLTKGLIDLKGTQNKPGSELSKRGELLEKKKELANLITNTSMNASTKEINIFQLKSQIARLIEEYKLIKKANNNANHKKHQARITKGFEERLSALKSASSSAASSAIGSNLQERFEQLKGATASSSSSSAAASHPSILETQLLELEAIQEQDLKKKSLLYLTTLLDNLHKSIENGADATVISKNTDRIVAQTKRLADVIENKTKKSTAANNVKAANKAELARFFAARIKETYSPSPIAAFSSSSSSAVALPPFTPPPTSSIRIEPKASSHGSAAAVDPSTSSSNRSAAQAAINAKLKGMLSATTAQRTLTDGYSNLASASSAATQYASTATSGLPESVNKFTNQSGKLHASFSAATAPNPSLNLGPGGKAGNVEALIKQAQNAERIRLESLFPSSKKGGKRSRRLKSKRSKKTRRHVRRV